MKYQILLFIMLWANLGFTQEKTQSDTCHVLVANTLTRNDGDKLLINSTFELYDFNFKIYNR